MRRPTYWMASPITGNPQTTNTTLEWTDASTVSLKTLELRNQILQKIKPPPWALYTSLWLWMQHHMNRRPITSQTCSNWGSNSDSDTTSTHRTRVIVEQSNSGHSNTSYCLWGIKSSHPILLPTGSSMTLILFSPWITKSMELGENRSPTLDLNRK